MDDNLLHENPMGTDGFAFVAFTSPNPELLSQQFKKLGFVPVAKHTLKNITLYEQGEIHFFLSQTTEGFSADFAKAHGASAFAMGFRVKDADYAFERALRLGAKPYTGGNEGFSAPAIYGIGGSLLYFIDDQNAAKIYKQDFCSLVSDNASRNRVGLTYIDHLTHNLCRGKMDQWADFYVSLFNFYEIRYFTISGKMTGLTSRALSSPCGKIRIPLNESSDDKSQIEEFLHEFHGEGIQHIALGTADIYETVEALHRQGIQFLEVPDSYYEMLEKRLPGHREDLPRLQKNRIIIDGTTDLPTPKLLLQIFTQNMLGPVFFEIIQRKGDEGFGEGNFQALFEAMELDQIRRGALKG
jgi:4-hydroxyphenylpyruvate dioxygenase